MAALRLPWVPGGRRTQYRQRTPAQIGTERGKQDEHNIGRIPAHIEKAAARKQMAARGAQHINKTAATKNAQKRSETKFKAAILPCSPFQGTTGPFTAPQPQTARPVSQAAAAVRAAFQANDTISHAGLPSRIYEKNAFLTFPVRPAGKIIRSTRLTHHASAYNTYGHKNRGAERLRFVCVRVCMNPLPDPGTAGVGSFGAEMRTKLWRARSLRDAPVFLCYDIKKGSFLWQQNRIPAPERLLNAR